MISNIDTTTSEKKQKSRKTYYLEEGNYITGYNATLVYLMSGLVKAVYILGACAKKKIDLLSNTCQLASVPLFQLTSPIKEFEDVEVLAVVDNSMKKD